MRVFSVPASVPFLRTVIAALVDGRLVDGFEARADPQRLAEATLYLPTRRAGRLVREVFLEELNREAVLLPRIVALGDIDEDELAFAEASESYGGAASLEIPPKLGELDRRLSSCKSRRGLGEASGIGAAGGRRAGVDACARRRPGAADGRHGHPRRRMGCAERAGAGPTRSILEILARVPADRAAGLAGASGGNPQDRARGAARSPDRCRSKASRRASRRPGDRGRLDRIDAGDREIPSGDCVASARRGRSAGARYRSRRRRLADHRRNQGRARQVHDAAFIESPAIRHAGAPAAVWDQAHRRRNTGKACSTRARRSAFRSDAAVKCDRTMASAAG